MWFILAALAAAAAVGLWFLDSRRNPQLQQAKDSNGTVEQAVAPAGGLRSDDTRQIVLPNKAKPSKGKHAKPEPVVTTKATIADRANSEEEHAEQSESEAPGRRDKWPGSSRRERRQWAMSRGFGYTKRDDFLHDEWARGTAASGAPVREVVSGTVGDYEMYLADIGGTTVMAVRRGSSSDIVVEAHRGVPQGAEDLVPVRSTAGFRILSNDVGATERLIDARVEAALTAMPAEVSQVWMESDWILAQFGPRTTPVVWEAASEPLALLADAARMLPPRTSALQVDAFDSLGSSRPMPAASESTPEPTPAPTPEPEPAPFLRVQRPDTPVEMPSRMHSEVRGVVEPRMVGVDEVDAIADGEKKPEDKPTQTPRIVREQRRPSSIFEDLAEEFGTNPLRDGPTL